MKSVRNVIIYILVYLIIIQVGIKYIVPTDVVYSNRLDYDLVKDRPTNIDAVLEKIKLTIDREKLEDYVIILGDSVAYSNPGPADSSLAPYLNEKAKENNKDIRFFNIAMPAMQTGDIYTVLLKMKEYGISSDHVVMNIIYAGFVERSPDPPAVFWLKNQLKELDKEAYNHVEDNLIANSQEKNSAFDSTFEALKTKMYENAALFKYKDYIQKYFKTVYSNIRGQEVVLEEIEPWYLKPELPDLFKEYMYQREFSDKPFIMEQSNLQIYFLDKIIELQEGKDTLIFLAAMNNELLQEGTSKEGYKENLEKIDSYFSDKGVDYINFNGQIPYELFSDHVHLTPEGYKLLADLLWVNVKNWD